MRKVTEMIDSFLWALFIVAVSIACIYAIADLISPIPHALRDIRPAGPVTKPARPISITDLGAVCERDGILITSMDRLRAAVTLADTMILRGGLNGQKLSMQTVRNDADRFAQLQVSPDVTLEMLGRCDESLLQKYPHGYWMISAALVRESARRRGTIAHPTITDPRAP